MKTEFETESRTNKLLSISELACQCGHFKLGRDWLQEAVSALRGYGYRKDSTVGLLIEALEEVNNIQPKLLRKYIADIAEWNLLMPRVTEDGKGIRWFPISLYNTALHFDSEIARELLLTYYKYVAEWKFSDVLANFLRSYNGDNLMLAYTLSELIHEAGFYDEDNYKDKFEARFNLLKIAIDQGNQTIIYWMAERIREFLTAEVPPTERLPFVEAFNQYTSDINLRSIQTYSTYPKANKTASKIDFEPPAFIKLDGEEILIGNLADKLSVSLEKLSHGIEQLLEHHSAYDLRFPIQQAIEKLVPKIQRVSELDQLASHVQENEEIAKVGYRFIARGYLNFARPDKAAQCYKEAFMLRNKLVLWNPEMDEFKQLAEIDSSEAFETLFEFIDFSFKDYSWGGEATFLLFIRAAMALGESYHKNALELYQAFHEFVQNQFEHLPVTSQSPYT